MGCFGAYFTHAQSCDKVCVGSIRNGLLAYIPTHAQICDNVRVQSTTEWIAFSPFSRFRRFRVFVFSRFRAWRFRVFAFSRFRVPPAAPAAGTQISCAQYMNTARFIVNSLNRPQMKVMHEYSISK